MISFVATNCQYLINLFARAVERNPYTEAVVRICSVKLLFCKFCKVTEKHVPESPLI